MTYQKELHDDNDPAGIRIQKTGRSDWSEEI